ncbi:hypothetical protein HPP92_008482 [Vanilla planifolia]|uniref:Uncharacterized protein n=1 Tax=Vanilla planifolia TaxID=51239 RepID=A0A835V4I6_VANPL|nr:hypothetical protein HPP92_008482 [Vanilla planifolia]
MAQIPNVDNSPLNLAALRESSQKELINILKNVRGKKCLVIDPKLGGSLSLLIQTSLLKENGVELRHLSAEPVQTECSKVLYLVRPQLNLMKFISSHILNDVSKGLQKEYFVYFVPRRTVVCEKIFEDEKVRHLLTLGEYPLYIMPLDEDVLSCELDTAFRECLVDGDMSSLWHVAKAIHKLELSFGVIPNLRAKGCGSAKIIDILNSLEAEDPVNAADMGIPEINTLILIDREDAVIGSNTKAILESTQQVFGISHFSEGKISEVVERQPWLGYDHFEGATIHGKGRGLGGNAEAKEQWLWIDISPNVIVMVEQLVTCGMMIDFTMPIAEENLLSE